MKCAHSQLVSRAARLHNARVSTHRNGGRVRGLVLLLILVVAGIGSGVGLFRWQAAGRAPELELPELAKGATPEQRLAAWLPKYIGPQLHRALQQARWSTQRPWLVTHIRQPLEVPGQPFVPELWGLKLERIGPEFARCEGLTITVRVPAPELLERSSEIEGALARSVPITEPGEQPPLERMTQERVRAFLSPVMTALARKLPGAQLEIEIEGLTGQPALEGAAPAR